jgi:hypothetical protein
MRAADVRRAAVEMRTALAPHTGLDWHAIPAGGLDWSCWTTAAHVGHDLLAYAGQLAGQPADDYLPFDLSIKDSATAGEVLDVVRACARLLATAVDAAGPEVRAWHWGPCDAGGFAALGVNETLLHTVDITRGLGVDWTPPADLCAAVLDRLFPTAPPGDPVEVLLWSTGRGELDGHDRLTSWVLKAAR